ncbi:transcription factor DIVARICATA-like [Nicotiana tabacum]|uniref:Transcription factor DIVARICATA-like n=1 Tax=Nicotiana tabacum TaxID=4097 RepID=A0A1S4BQA2_TOBAC|nr:transcription factor DIVARICATA-like [Nicotiana tomentosiformis]XP_016491072.1 PREDICTED: transcription factor DIVARICATA-like [Nicotiana tabacum]
METIFPISSSWMMQQNKSSIWTKEENKLFESAIAIYDENTPNRWFQVADMIPGKSVLDVMKQYQELAADVCDIEAGLVPNPGYFASSVTLELVDDCGLQTFRKRGRSSDQERKKGVPWTEEEHRRFLMGLDKYGKGDWRNISKKMVISRTPTQVASHAQKYYQRQLSGCKDKRRPSIHDITTFHFVADTSGNNINSLSKEKFYSTPLQKFTTTTDVVNYWNSSSDEDLMDFGSSYGSSVVAYPSEITSQSWDGHGANGNSQLQIQSTRYEIWDS